MLFFMVVIVLFIFCFALYYVYEKFETNFSRCDDCHALIDNNCNKICPRCGCPNSKYVTNRINTRQNIDKNIKKVNFDVNKKTRKANFKIKYEDVIKISYIVIGLLLLFIFSILVMKGVKHRKQVDRLNSYRDSYEYRK